MKKLALLALAMGLIGTSAFAQNASGPGRTIGNGEAKLGNKQNLTMRAIRMALEEIKKGNGLLRDALGIYDGHRVSALKWAEVARSEIRVGIMEQKLGYQSNTETATDSDSKKKYTKEQIDRSNLKLVIGARHYENAISLLSKSNWEQVKRKEAAIVALQKALQELRLALAPYGGPDAYQKMAGDRGKINPK